MSKLHRYNTIDDILSNKRLKDIYNKTEQLFKKMSRSNKISECVFCGREHIKSNFPSCKICKKPNMLIKFGFVDSGKVSRYNGGY